MMTQIRIEETIKRIFSGTLIVTIGLFINSFFSYLLQLFLGRTLSLEEYATFNSILSVFYLFNVFTSVISISIIKIVSELISKQQYGALTTLFLKLVTHLAGIGLSIFVLLLVLKNYLSSFLNISDSTLIIFLGFYIFANFLVVTPGAYIQGMLRFKLTSFFYAFSGLIRFVLPVIFVFSGFRVNGIYFALSLGVIIAFFVVTLLLQKNFDYTAKKIDVSLFYKRILEFSGSVFFISIFMQALNSVDLVLVKKFFDGEQAGYYAGVATIGKMILFGAGSITIVMLPQISALKTAGKSYMDKFKFFLILQFAITLLALAVFAIFPKYITLLFFGDKFFGSILFLPKYSLYISLYVMSNFLITFFLAINKINIYRLILIPLIVQIFLIYHFHSNLIQILYANITAVILLLVSLIIYLYKVIKVN